MAFLQQCKSDRSMNFHMSATRMLCIFTGSVGAGMIYNGITPIAMVLFFVAIFCTMDQTAKINWKIKDMETKKWTGRSKRQKRH
jgi:hypothetical protein